VGILEESHSSFDNVVFTQIKTLWDMHDHGGEHGEHEEGEEHQHTHGTVCAILINTKNPGYAMQLVQEYDGKIITTEDDDNYTLQAIEPMSIVRDVLNDADDTKYIVFVLCAVILIMNIMIISIITLLNMYHSAKEISLMRLIGISMKKINLLYIIQNSIMGLVSVLLAFGVSRICMSLMNGYVESMGVVLNMSKVYPMEFIILLAVFIISVLPTVIWTFCMSRKDSIAD
jgi:putative ABC transport system permease protein